MMLILLLISWLALGLVLGFVAGAWWVFVTQEAGTE